MAPERARILTTIVTVALATAPLAVSIVARSGRPGWAKFFLAWFLCYCGAVVFGIAVAIVQGWVRPLATDDVRRMFEDRVMSGMVAVALIALIAIVMR